MFSEIIITIIKENKALAASYDGGETGETNCTAATTVLHPVSCKKQIHHTDPWPQLLSKTRMNQINIGEALGSGSLSV